MELKTHLTAAAALALSTEFVDAQDWLQRFASHRATQVIDDIAKKVLQHCMTTGEAMPTDQEAIVQFALTNRLVLTAAEKIQEEQKKMVDTLSTDGVTKQSPQPTP